MLTKGVLEPEEEEVLSFILDCTIEKWETEEPGQMKLIALDPGLETLEDLLEATGSLSKLTEVAKRIRAKMFSP